MNDQQSPASDVLFREEGRAGFITLNRPQALNALTHDMIEAMEAHYVKWAAAPRIYGVILESAKGRAFCGGGDVRSLTAGGNVSQDASKPFFLSASSTFLLSSR